jgi:hypothetical protein
MYPSPDEPDETSTDTPSNNGAGNPDQEDDQMEGETALLPASILGGKEFSPGEEVVLKIVAMHDDQVEVAYASDSGKGDEDKGSEMDQAQGRLAARGGPGDGSTDY